MIIKIENQLEWGTLIQLIFNAILNINPVNIIYIEKFVLQS